MFNVTMFKKRQVRVQSPASKKQYFLLQLRRFPAGDLLVFIVKQGWAALFGGLLLLAIIVTKYVQLPLLPRYDWLFIIAVLIQLAMLAFKLERPREVITILVFHVVGLAMELFKTSGNIGSWVYPEQSVIRIATVPLFSGFMYAAVGSYIARAWRVLNLRFINYPRRVYTVLLAILIYANFYTHHYMIDIRVALFIALAVLFWRTKVYFTLNHKERHMPLLAGFLLIALFIWFAENIGTFTGAWLYHEQLDGWHMVSIQKIGAWLLLMVISFIMIDLLHVWYKKRLALGLWYV